jgi:hypothetical protein
MSNGFRIYMQVVFTYLRITEKEREDIKDDPKEFVNYGVDICQKQESKTYKTQAAKLLEHLADHVDGMLTFVVDFNLKVMTYILSRGMPEDPEAGNRIKETIMSFNLNIYSEEELMDICFLSLSVLSYALVKRGDLLLLLD